ncbi:MAG: phosphatidate cytidylyltransferase [Spiroplasma sp.]|nr:phosphatidate cytidylyltransferase [Spiroplasma sp.]
MEQKVKIKQERNQKNQNSLLKNKSLLKRSITGVFLVIAAVGWMFSGAVYLVDIFGTKPIWSAYTFMAINSLLLMMAIYEIVNLRKGLNWNISIKILVFAMALILLWLPLGNETFGPYIYNDKWFSFWITLVSWIFFILLFLIIRFSVKNFTYNDWAFICFWTFYLVFVFKGVNFLMLQEQFPRHLGWATFTYLWVIILSNDIFAYFGGSLWGKHFMAPRISPKKTWEGAIVGFIFGVALSMTTVAILVEITKIDPLPIYQGVVGKIPMYFVYLGLSCLLSALTQIGDLLFSLLKRNHNVKDFSNIFPGHGGLLDRLDGFSLVVLFTYFLTFLLFSNL